jgi:HAD superfamily hydrolase (TIGR01509 family)
MSLDVSRVRWIFFDVGWTLIDESVADNARFQQLGESLRTCDIGCTADDLRRAYDQAWRRREPNRVLYMVNTVAPGLLQQDPDFVYRNSEWAGHLERPVRGATDVLRALAAHYKVGVIANQRSGTWERLCGHGWRDFISVCISSTEEGVTKPDPRIFQLALERAGCVASEAVMIGDRLDNDVGPAKSVGMQTIRVLQGWGAVQSPIDENETPDATVNSLTELPRLFSRFSA